MCSVFPYSLTYIACSVTHSENNEAWAADSSLRDYKFGRSHIVTGFASAAKTKLCDKNDFSGFTVTEKHARANTKFRCHVNAARVQARESTIKKRTIAAS